MTGKFTEELYKRHKKERSTTAKSASGKRGKQASGTMQTRASSSGTSAQLAFVVENSSRQVKTHSMHFHGYATER